MRQSRRHLQKNEGGPKRRPVSTTELARRQNFKLLYLNHDIAFPGRCRPADLPMHTMLDNYSANKHEAVTDWPKDHRRWTFHFTPTPCSWVNAVEGFFGKLARRRHRRGVNDSIKYLKWSILDFIALHNEKEANPFKWTAGPRRLVASRQRGYQKIATDQQKHPARRREFFGIAYPNSQPRPSFESTICARWLSRSARSSGASIYIRQRNSGYGKPRPSIHQKLATICFIVYPLRLVRIYANRCEIESPMLFPEVYSLIQRHP